MMLQEKECIEYALHAYDTYWDYYKKTLDERNQILNNYMVFVGIPVSIIGVLLERIKNNVEDYSGWFILAFAVILTLGYVIYDAYIVESFISERYLKQISKITKYLADNYDDDYKNVFEEAYALDQLFLDEGESQNHRIRKSFIILIINTAVVIGIFFVTLEKYFELYYIPIPVLISLLTHMAIFIFRKQNFVQSFQRSTGKKRTDMV